MWRNAAHSSDLHFPVDDSCVCRRDQKSVPGLHTTPSGRRRPGSQKQFPDRCGTIGGKARGVKKGDLQMPPARQPKLGKIPTDHDRKTAPAAHDEAEAGLQLGVPPGLTSVQLERGRHLQPSSLVRGQSTSTPHLALPSGPLRQTSLRHRQRTAIPPALSGLPSGRPDVRFRLKETDCPPLGTRPHDRRRFTARGRDGFPERIATDVLEAASPHVGEFVQRARRRDLPHQVSVLGRPQWSSSEYLCAALRNCSLSLG